MKISTSRYSPKEIVGNNIRFRIPLYQRPYTWGEKQVKQLMDDLFDSFERSKDNPQSYYIGIMNVSQTDYDDSTFDLIDGQQRLTTLSVIALVMKYYENQDVKIKSNWSDFCGRIDFYGRVEDKAFLSDGTEQEKLNSKLVEARNVIKKFCEEKKMPDDKTVSDFSLYIYEYTSFFLSEIPKDYTIIEKNKQFIRMNNRGKQLELTDVLKVKLVNVLEEDNAKDQINDFLDEWNKISQMHCSENINDENEERTINNILIDLNEKIKEPSPNNIYYESILSFDEFLLIALDRFLVDAVSYDKSKILSSFGFEDNNICMWNSEKVLSFRKKLSTQYNLLVEYFIRKDKTDNFKWQFEEQENNSNKESRETTQWKNLKQFQSYLYVSREPHEWMKEAFDWLENAEKVTAESFLKELKKNDNNKGIALLLCSNSQSIKEFIPAYFNTTYYPHINRYWFWRLDYYLWENRSTHFKDINQRKVADNYVFKSNRSVEHVAPQTPKHNKSDEIEWKGTEEDEHLRDCFGNLCMISGSQNSSLSNEAYGVKREIVKSFVDGNKNGTIESLKLLKIFAEYDQWKKTSIPEHGEAMLEILENSFKTSSEKEE